MLLDAPSFPQASLSPSAFAVNAVFLRSAGEDCPVVIREAQPSLHRNSSKLIKQRRQGIDNLVVHNTVAGDESVSVLHLGHVIA